MKVARHLPVAFAVLLVSLLALLAALQWRWIGEVSAMDQQRMRSSLLAAGSHFTQDFDREVTRAFLYFHPDPNVPQEQRQERVLRQYERWQSEAPYPRLVRDVFVIRRGGREPEIEVLRPREHRFEACPWPAELAAVRRETSAPLAARPGFWGMAPAVLEDVPGLVIPLGLQVPPEGGAGGNRLAGPRLLVRLDSRILSNDFFPALTRRYFDNARGGDYALAVMNPLARGRVVFLSDPSVPAASFGAGDLRLQMLTLRPFEELHALWPRHAARSHRWHMATEMRPRIGPPPLLGDRARERGAWELVIKHRDGSLEAAVAAVRHRNLGISLGILTLLAVTVGMLMVTTQRAQRLARQQIEFVAGVTHELHTPLTAIRSAGQNLADGVVAEPSQVRRYGTLIANEGRRLSDMVGQALEFAGIQSGRRFYHRRPVEVAEIVDGALQDCRWLLQERRIEVERELAPDLPAVRVDGAALRRAVQNLIENAIKHGGRAGWIGVKAGQSASGQVEITVADHGPGIRREDLPHLFKPFFRGRDAAVGGVPGSGLGLSLVRSIAEAHGGGVTVHSSAETGSAFTLHLPAVAVAGEVQAVEEPA